MSSLDPAQRLALQNAVNIANSILAGGGDAQSVAIELTWLAQFLCGDDVHARYTLAWRMLDTAEELRTMIRVDEAARLNGHVASLGS
jgi:hypothetical protein